MNIRAGIAAPIVMAGLLVLSLPTARVRPGESSSAAGEPAVLVGAGDIADCRDPAGAQATAKLLEKIPGTVMAVGDLA